MTYRLFGPDLENPGPDDFAPISQMMHTLPVPWVEPIDISNAVLFLASDESRYITGVSLPVDAGAYSNNTNDKEVERLTCLSTTTKS